MPVSKRHYMTQDFADFVRRFLTQALFV